MLSYQHGFHAGNRADVLKHAVMEAVLAHASNGTRDVLYVETHAGRGRYDLTSAQATKRNESVAGVQALLKGRAPPPLRDWVSRVEARGLTDYPGSPALALSILPASARAILFELHPAENAALAEAVGGDARVQIKKADGYAGALKLSPRTGEQMIVLVDPSYETDRDIDGLVDWVPRALRRWPAAILCIWVPLFRDGREQDFIAFLEDLPGSMTAAAHWPLPRGEQSSLTGSAMVLFALPEATRTKTQQIALALQEFWRNA